MFGSFKNRNQSLWLCCLCCFIYENLFEFKRFQPLIESRHTCCAYDIGITHDLIFSLPLQVFVYLFIFFIELTLFFLQGHQVLHPLVMAMFEMFYLLMQWDIVNIWSNGFSWPCTEPDNFEPSAVYLLGQLIYCNIGWCTNKDLAQLLLDKMIYQSRRGHSLSCARWSLNQSQRSRERFLHRIHLKMIQFWQPLNRELLWNRSINILILSIISEYLVKNVIGQWSLILQEYLESLLHSVKWSWFPHKLNDISRFWISW